MPALLLAFLLSASIKDGPTPLRSGCSSDARVLASLPSGAPVTIRYSISGETEPCYKVSVEVEGKTLEGSLPASAIDLADHDTRGRGGGPCGHAQGQGDDSHERTERGDQKGSRRARGRGHGGSPRRSDWPGHRLGTSQCCQRAARATPREGFL